MANRKCGLTLARTRGNLGDLLWVAGDLNGWWDAFQSAVVCEFSVTVCKSEAVTLRDPVMPVANGFLG